MFSFKYRGQSIHLRPGQQWAAEPNASTYHDTSPQELRAIVAKVNAGIPWTDCIRQHFSESNPWLSRIVSDPARSRFFREFPPKPGSRILDIGAGWGQITLPLARHNTVVAIEPTPERLAFIAACARQDGLEDSIAFAQADFLDLEIDSQFDLICCIGVLEWVPKFRSGMPDQIQQDFLRRIRSLLAPGGKVVVAIENRLGLKYLLGAPDDHTGQSNISVLDQDLAQRRHHAATSEELRCFTYSLAEYRGMLAKAGFATFNPYAAFPDYKLPEFIHPADATLSTELLRRPFIPEYNGFNGQELSAEFQESLGSHYQAFAQEGVAHSFAPSYFLVAGNQL